MTSTLITSPLLFGTRLLECDFTSKQVPSTVPQWRRLQEFSYKYQSLSGSTKSTSLLRQPLSQEKRMYEDFIQYIRLSYDGKTLGNEYNDDDAADEDYCNYDSHHRYYLPTNTQDTKHSLPPTLPLLHPPTRPLTSLKVNHFGEAVYDCRFFPTTASSSPSTLNPTEEISNPYLFLATKDHPIHLYNLATDQICASYVIHNSHDELETIYTLNYNSTFNKLIAGANSFVYLFDLQNPSEVFMSFPTNKEEISSKPNPFACKGMISCIESNPDYSGLFAIGTLSNDVAFYDERNLPTAVITMKNIPSAQGIIQLKWSTCGNYIFINCRKHNYIYCYDVRSQKKIIGKFYRFAENNYQKMIMDIDPWGDYLVTGNQAAGTHHSLKNEDAAVPTDPILIYNAKTFEFVGGYDPFHENNDNGATIHTTLFHPYYSLLLTASGDRVFLEGDDSLSESESESEEEGMQEGYPVTKKRSRISWEADNTNCKGSKKEHICQSRLSILSLPKTQLFYEEAITATATTAQDANLFSAETIPMIEENEDGEIAE